MTVDSALRHFLHTAPQPTLGPERRPASRRDILARDLMTISRTNRIYFTACFGAVVLVLVGAAVIVMRHIDSVGTIQAVFAVLGISITGLTAQMASLWKHKVAADMLLVLARNVEQDQLKSILDALMAKL